MPPKSGSPTALRTCSTRYARSSSIGADVIKICATGGVLSLGDDPQHSQFTQAGAEPPSWPTRIGSAARWRRTRTARRASAGPLKPAWIRSSTGSYIDDAAIAVMKQTRNLPGADAVPGRLVFRERAEAECAAADAEQGAGSDATARKNVAHAFASGVKWASAPTPRFIPTVSTPMNLRSWSSWG